MIRTIIIGLLVASAGCAQGRGGAGYLPASEMPDMVRIAPPPPTPGGPQNLADLAIFKSTRELEGTPRWAAAQSDNEFTAAYIMKAFSCSSGLTLDAQKTPRFAAMAAKLFADSIAAFNPPKNKYQTKRPFLTQAGNTCVNSVPLANNSDYPSGHTVLGWTVGSILAEVEPDRAADILVRARAFGENRVVCGVHTASAVEGGRMIAAALVAALHGSASFRSDLEAVRTESAVARESAPAAPASCAAEAATLSKTPY
jgi:acid phosphatase (class A)